MPEDTTATRWLPQFVALSAIWGASFALIKVADDHHVAAPWVAFGRCLFGALTLLAVCTVRRERLPRDPVTWAHGAVVAVLANVIPFTLFAFGEQRIDSVLAGVLNATTPLMTLVFVLLLVPTETITAPRLVGLATGFLGVLCVLHVWSGLRGGSLVGGLACLGATAGYGATFGYTRRWFSGRPGSAAALSALQIGCATVELAVVAPLASGAPQWPGARALIALVALGAFGTGFAFLFNLHIIRAAGPTIASTVTYAVPLWSTAIGAVLLSEPVAWNTFVGGAVVIAGILVTKARPGLRVRRRRPVSADGSPG